MDSKIPLEEQIQNLTGEILDLTTRYENVSVAIKAAWRVIFLETCTLSKRDRQRVVVALAQLVQRLPQQIESQPTGVRMWSGVMAAAHRAQRAGTSPTRIDYYGFKPLAPRAVT